MAEDNLTLIDVGRYSPIDIRPILKECKNFNNIMSANRNIENKENLMIVLKQLQKARLNFSRAKNMISTLFKPQDNEYLKECEENHDWMVDDLGRVEKGLDNKTEGFAKSLQTLENNIMMGRKITFAKVSGMYNFLNESMSAIVINPLITTFKRYMKVRNTITAETEYKWNLRETRENTFVYWLFLEVYHGSLYVGAITREKKPKNVGKGKQTQQFTTTNYPPTIPSSNLGISKNDIKQEEGIVNQFSDPFSEEEND